MKKLLMSLLIFGSFSVFASHNELETDKCLVTVTYKNIIKHKRTAITDYIWMRSHILPDNPDREVIISEPRTLRPIVMPCNFIHTLSVSPRTVRRNWRGDRPGSRYVKYEGVNIYVENMESGEVVLDYNIDEAENKITFPRENRY